ncbi:MAG: hypothetical protein ACREQQ_18390 [Candidatus Binatia bacterium]
MSLRVRSTVMAFVLAGVSGCAPALLSVLGSSSAQREFFPLRPGTFWVYEVRDARGRVALERVLVRGPFFVKTHGADGVIVEESGGMSGEFDLDVSWHPVVYYRRGEFLYKFSGLNEVGGELTESPLGDGEEKVLPADPTAHREWESSFQIFQVDRQNGYGARMTSVVNPSRESVRVRAGTFRDCLRVDSRSVLANRDRRDEAPDVSFQYTDWYAPGVGLVKSEVHESVDHRPISTMELISFREGRESD